MPPASTPNKQSKRNEGSPSPSRPTTKAQEEENQYQHTSSLASTLRDNLPSTYNKEIRLSVQRTRAALKKSRISMENTKPSGSLSWEEAEDVEGGFRPSQFQETEPKHSLDGDVPVHRFLPEEEEGGAGRSSPDMRGEPRGAAGERWALRVNGPEDQHEAMIKRVLIGGGIPERRSVSIGTNTTAAEGEEKPSSGGTNPKKTSPADVKRAPSPTTDRLGSSSPKRVVVVRTDEHGELPRQALSVSPPPPPESIFFCPRVGPCQ